MNQIKKLTRVKYNNVNGVYTSHKEFLGNEGTLFNVQIDSVNKTVSVLQVTGEVYSKVESSGYGTFTGAKTLAKELLKKYGVTFHEEVRRKKTKATPVAVTEASSVEVPVGNSVAVES